MIDDVQPVGVVEHELATTIAAFLWRRRVAAYEGAMTAGIGELPPDPDEVVPERTRTGIDPPATAPVTTRLVHLRAVLRSGRAGLADQRATAALAAGLADAPADAAVGPDCGLAVVLAAGATLGWPWDPDLWPPVLGACGLPPTSVWVAGGRRGSCGPF